MQKKHRNVRKADTLPIREKTTRKQQKGDKFLAVFEKYGVIVACVLAAIVYFQTLSYDLTNLDDIIIRTEYEFFSDLSRIGEVFTGGYLGTGYYRPIVTSSLMIDAAIGGESVIAYHFSNTLFHVLAVLGLFLLLKEMNLGTGRAFTGAVLYAVHPLFTN